MFGFKKKDTVQALLAIVLLAIAGVAFYRLIKESRAERAACEARGGAYVKSRFDMVCVARR